MPNGLEKSLQVLATTRNEAAAAVLLRALDSPYTAVQAGAARALLERRSPAGLRELIGRWGELDLNVKSIVDDYGGRLTGAIRDAILSQDAALCASGCDLAQRTRQYELSPALINAVESGDGRPAQVAAETLLQLAQLLQDELARNHDWRRRRDPQLTRARVVSALELAVRRFPRHQRMEILTAFLILAGRDNATLKRILREPLDRSHTAVANLLTHSRRPAIVRLVVSFLDDARAPQSALSVVARREDDDFLLYVLKSIGLEPNTVVRNNLGRMTKISWLRNNTLRLTMLDEQAQCAAVQAAVCWGAPQTERLDVLKTLLTHGKPPARRAVSAALSEFHGAQANRLIMQALRDDDVQVQASALGQLRERGLPGAMATLIDALDSEYVLLRETARRCLSEFNFQRYLTAYEGMNDEVRRSTGQLVSKVDMKTLPLLQAELESASRSRRLRALDVALSLEVLVELETTIHAMLSDDDHIVRLEAASVLAECPTEPTRLALRGATLDSSSAVCNAAQRSLDNMVTAGAQRRQPIDVAAVSLPDNGARGAGGDWTW